MAAPSWVLCPLTSTPAPPTYLPRLTPSEPSMLPFPVPPPPTTLPTLSPATPMYQSPSPFLAYLIPSLVVTGSHRQSVVFVRAISLASTLWPARGLLGALFSRIFLLFFTQPKHPSVFFFFFHSHFSLPLFHSLNFFFVI